MALTVAASLAQIGEFSFILAGLGVGLGVMPEDGRDLILAGAILSIMLHPFIVSVIERERKEAGELSEAPAPASLAEEAPTHRIVLVGYGRLGSLVGGELKAGRRRFTVIRSESRRVGKEGG